MLISETNNRMAENIASSLNASNSEEYIKYLLFSKDNVFYDEVQAIWDIQELYSLRNSESDSVKINIIDDRIFTLSNSCLALEKLLEISQDNTIRHRVVSNIIDKQKLNEIYTTDNIQYLSRLCKLGKEKIKAAAYKRFSLLVNRILSGNHSSGYIFSIYELCPEDTGIQKKCLDAWRAQFMAELQSISAICAAREYYIKSRFDKSAHKAAYQKLCGLLQKELSKNLNIRKLLDLYFQSPEKSKVRLEIFAKLLNTADSIKLMDGLIGSFRHSSRERHLIFVKLDKKCLELIKRTNDIEKISNVFHYAPVGYESRPYAIKKVHYLLQNQTPAR